MEPTWVNKVEVKLMAINTLLEKNGKIRYEKVQKFYQAGVNYGFIDKVDTGDDRSTELEILVRTHYYLNLFGVAFLFELDEFSIELNELFDEIFRKYLNAIVRMGTDMHADQPMKTFVDVNLMLTLFDEIIREFAKATGLDYKLKDEIEEIMGRSI